MHENSKCIAMHHGGCIAYPRGYARV
jgi:hypothetical protein